jgi:hypothetical protein
LAQKNCFQATMLPPCSHSLIAMWYEEEERFHMTSSRWLIVNKLVSSLRCGCGRQHKVISLTPLTCILLLMSHVTAQSHFADTTDMYPPLHVTCHMSQHKVISLTPLTCILLLISHVVHSFTTVTCDMRRRIHVI